MVHELMSLAHASSFNLPVKVAAAFLRSVASPLNLIFCVARERRIKGKDYRTREITYGKCLKTLYFELRVDPFLYSWAI